MVLRQTQRLHRALIRYRNMLGGSIYEYSLVGVVFFVLTLFYTNFTLLNGNHQLFIDGPGDGTAGFLWFNTVDRDWDPALSHTDMANYPTGENLQNPTQITYSAVLMPLWLMSRLFGPIMGLNIVTFFGFWICGVTMYWLVKKLTNHPLVAFYAGFAATFTPYHLMKSSSHLTYIFSVVFVLMLAAFIGYWKHPTIKRAVLFALSIALAFYTDGYYLLIGSIYVLLLVGGGCVYNIVKKSSKKIYVKQMKYLCITGVMTSLLVLPIAYTQLSQSSKVSGFLSHARGNIASDIQHYASHPIDFVLPAPSNPFLANDANFQQLIAYKNNRSNGSESTTYIGIIVTLTCIVGFTLASVYIVAKKYSSLAHFPGKTHFIILACISFVVVPGLLLCMLPPHYKIGGIPIPTLASVLLYFDISLWRVMARFYLPLHIVLVAFSAISLSFIVSVLASKLAKNKHASLTGGIPHLVIILVTVLTAAEYATSASTASYDFKNTPRVYSWINEQRDIKVIAELPLVDRPLDISYNFVTAQITHEKKLVNTPLTYNIPGGRTALGGVHSTEAVAYAAARGADTIITHGQPCRDSEWGSVVYKDENASMHREASYYGSPICVYRIASDFRADPLFVELKYGTFADAPYFDTKTGKDYVMMYGMDAELRIVDAYGKNRNDTALLSATISTTPGESLFRGRWRLIQNGNVLSEGNVPGLIMAQNVNASLPVEIKLDSELESASKPYAVSLSNVVVTKQ